MADVDCKVDGTVNNVPYCTTHSRVITLCFFELRDRVEIAEAALKQLQRERFTQKEWDRMVKKLDEAEAVNQVWRRHLVGTDSPHIECMLELAAKCELADLKRGIDASGVGDLVGENAALQTRLAEADRLLRLVWPFLGFKTTEGQSLESLRLDIQHHLRVSDTEKEA